jgi:hypothetical protein
VQHVQLAVSMSGCNAGLHAHARTHAQTWPRGVREAGKRGARARAQMGRASGSKVCGCRAAGRWPPCAQAHAGALAVACAQRGASGRLAGKAQKPLCRPPMSIDRPRRAAAINCGVSPGVSQPRKKRGSIIKRHHLARAERRGASRVAVSGVACACVARRTRARRTVRTRPPRAKGWPSTTSIIQVYTHRVPPAGAREVGKGTSLL